MKKVMQKNISKLSVAALFAAGSMSASAFEIENDGWTFSLHGNVNTSYIHTSCDSSTAQVDGAFMCQAGSVLGDVDSASTITNGYLPTTFQFGLATNKGGYDITVNSAFDRGLDTDEAFNVNAGDDDGFRIWMTVGNDDMGTVTLGRDWGLFGYDATFQDMSVFGVGAGLTVNNPVNTQLGAAGTGYIFLDRITQATWTLPTSDSVVAQIGLFQPLNISSFTLTNGFAFGGAETGSEQPGVHGRFRYNFGNGFISSSFITQDVEATSGAVTADYRAVGYDLTGQLNFGDLSLTGTYYKGDGLGHTGLLIDPVDAAGKERDSDGYLVQAVYTAGSTRYGLNYGMNNLDTSAADAATTLEEKSKITAGVYHSLASGITLVGEYSAVSAESKDGNEIDNDVVSIGAIFFF